MRRRLNFAIVAGVIAATAVAFAIAGEGLPALADHTDDHANDVTDARLVSLPALVTGEIEVAGDLDVFLFELTTGSRYSFYLAPQDSLNGALELRDPADQLVASNADCTAGGCTSVVEAAIEVTADSTGTFALTVSSAANAGRYTLFAKDLTPQPLPIPASATAVVDDSIDFAVDRDPYAVDLVGGKTYLFFAEHVASLAVELQLLDANDVIVLRNADCTPLCISDRDASIEFTPISSGRFTLVVNNEANGGSCRLFAKDLTPVPLGPVTIDALSHTDIHDYVIDRDIFSVELNGDTRYHFFALHSTGVDLALELRDPSGVPIASNFDCSAECASPLDALLDLTVTDPGTYELTVLTPSGGGRSYTLFARDFTPRAFPAPTVAGVTVREPIAFPTDIGRHAVDLVEGTRYAFFGDPIGNFDTTLELVSPGGIIFAAPPDCRPDCRDADESRIEFVAPESGTYLVTLDGPAANGRDYFLSAKDLTPQVFPTPTPTSVNVSDRIAFATDFDRYIVDLVAGTPYAFWADPTRFDSALELHAPSGAVFTSTADCRDRGCTHQNDSRLEFVAPDTGTYELILSDPNNVGRDYRLFARDLAATVLDPPPVEGERVENRIRFPSDVTHFDMELQADTPYLFFLDPTVFNAQLELRDASRTLLAVNNDCTADGCPLGRQATLEFTPEASGTYRLSVLSVVGGGREYRLFTKDLTPQPIAPLTSTPAETNDRIVFPLDRDPYAVQLLPGRIYRFHVVPTNYNATLELRGPDGEVLVTNSDCTADGCSSAEEAQIDFQPTVGGSYRVTVFAPPAGGREYRLTSQVTAVLGSITIVKRLVEPDPTDFTFEAGPAPLAAFTLDDARGTDDDAFTDRVTFEHIPADVTYTVEELPVPGFALEEITCDATSGITTDATSVRSRSSPGRT